MLPVTMGLLDTTGGGGALSGSLSGQLLTRSFSSSGLTSSLLGTSHYDKVSPEVNIDIENNSVHYIVHTLCLFSLTLTCFRVAPLYPLFSPLSILLIYALIAVSLFLQSLYSMQCGHDGDTLGMEINVTL